MDLANATAFAQRWCADWNSHDLERILSHFHDDVVFTSPVGAQVLPETGGVFRGKAALRAYWQLGLARIPDLHFTVVAVYTGVDTVVINYRNQVGNLVCEVLRLDGDVIVEGHGTYSSPGGAAAATGVRPA
jgi:ketosteroid isomerase-like protein